MNVSTFSIAYSYQLLFGYLICLNLSHPNSVMPIECINIVVDCILVDPANAI